MDLFVITEALMKKIRHFKCTSSQVTFERWVNDTVDSVDCECKHKAVKQLSAPKCFSNSATCEGKSPSC